MGLPSEIITGLMGSSGYIGYEIDQSMVLDGSSDYLSFTPGGAGDRRTWTLSLWTKRHELGRLQTIFQGGTSALTDAIYIWFEADDKLRVLNGSAAFDLKTNRVFRDVASWYHIVVVLDTTESTSSNRASLYVNGIKETSFATSSYPTLNKEFHLNNTYSHQIGAILTGPTNYNNASYAELYFIDGTAYEATDFGEFFNGTQWRAIQPSGLTYGTNGFYLPFTQDTPNLGTDYSGNGNDWTENGSPVQSSDSPTVNYATFNVVDIRQSGAIFSEGNLRVSTSTAAVQKTASTIAFDASGHYYAEFLVNATSGTNRESIGIINTANFGDNNNAGGYGANEYCIRLDDGNKYNNNSEVAYGDSYAATDVVGVRVDNGSLYFYKNGTIQNSGTAAYTGLEGSCRFYVTVDDGGTNPDITARFNSTDWTIGTPPTGANDLSAANLPEVTITDPGEYFNAVGYTGDGTAIGSGGQSITGVGFQSDFTWIKNRDQADSHMLFDVIRGATKVLHSNQATAETTESETLDSFDSDGFTLGSDVEVNTNTEDYISWNWKAGGAGVVNTDGTISSTVSVNDDAGFSIVSYTGTGLAGTVGHGLSDAPEMIIVKNRDQADAWAVYHSGIASDAETDYLVLNTTEAAVDNNNRWNDTAPTASLFSIGTAVVVNTNTENFIAYCFRSIPGYNKVGSLELNNSTDGTFIQLGFKPAFFLMKMTASGHWGIWDDIRNPFNVSGTMLRTNDSGADLTGYDIDILSNGVKIRDNHGQMSSGTAVFYAVARHPFGGSNIPLGLAQ
jgi:hypothetical protein